MIDGIGRVIQELFEAKERHLKEQEDFEKNEIARIVAEKQAERVVILMDLEYLTETVRAQLNDNSFGPDDR